MSLPQPACRFWRAAQGDQKAFDRLVHDMEYNFKKGSFSVLPCPHDPPCKQPTQEEEQAMVERLMKALEARRLLKKAQPPS